MESMRRFLGMPPHDIPSNEMLMSIPYIQMLIYKYGKEKVERAQKILVKEAMNDD